MSWTDEKAAVAREVITEFSDSVAYTPKNAASVQLSAAYFDKNHVEIIGKDPEGDPIHGVRPRLCIPLALVGEELTSKPKREDRFTTGGQEYQVEEVRNWTSNGYYECISTEVR